MTHVRVFVCLLAFLVFFSPGSLLAESKDVASQPAVPKGARVFFIAPTDGGTVTSPVKVEMGVEGMVVSKAGMLKAGEGHHHLIIGKDGVQEGGVVPADKKHIHFGGGQTETMIELEPGTHQLTLQFADGFHRSYGPALAETITVTVK